MRVILNTIHPEPEKARSEGPDTLRLDDIAPLVAALPPISSHARIFMNHRGEIDHMLVGGSAMGATRIANQSISRQSWPG